MPRTSLTVQEPTRFTQLTNPTQNAPDVANGNRFVNDGKIMLYVVNGSGGNITVTVDIAVLYDTDIAITDRSYTLATGTRTCLGPFPTSYNQTLDSVANSIGLNISSASSVTVELIRITAAN